MGNRAAVIFTNEQNDISPVVYLHWNGGAESVYPFLDEMKRRLCYNVSPGHQAARFAHIVCDFWDNCEQGAGAGSIAILAPPAELTPSGLRETANTADDNGIYLVSFDGKGKYRVRRFYYGTDEACHEMSKREVNAERKKAYQDALAYTSGKGRIAKEFLAMRPKINPNR